MNEGYESSSSSGSSRTGSSGSGCSRRGGDAVEVAVQLSRFHLETLEGGPAGDVDVRGLCLSVGDRALLADAHLVLRRGVRYGLVGRNGCGKSTLLRALASKTIPGLPRDMKVLYVQQDNVPGDHRTALQTVLEAGSPRGALQALVSELEAALDEQEEQENEGEGEGQAVEEGGTEAAAETAAARAAAAGGRSRLVRCVRRILAGRAEDQAVVAEQTAARRSRARGKEALRAAVAAREAAHKTKEERLTPGQAASLAPQLLTELYDTLEQLGSSEEEEQRAAAAVLDGLGFGGQQQQLGETPTRELSGGWRMRVALACALLAQPHLLLLDEPTNHLDIASILWLQDYLTNRCPTGQVVLLVSHDRSFLNAVAQETVVMADGGLRYFPGTYDAYLQARAEASVHKERQVAGQERQRTHLLGTIARAERAAREAGDDKRLLQAASRRKKMDRLGAEKTADGKRFKVSYWAGYHETRRPQVELDKPEEPVVIQFPPPEQVRQRGPLLQLRDVTVAYGKVDPAAAAVAAATAAAPQPAVARTGGGARGAAAAAAAPPPPPPPGGKKLVGGAAAAAKDATRRASAASTVPETAAAPAGGGGGGGGDGGVVLGHVTMDVEAGARIGLLGLNGSGKSSLLRVLGGQMAPAAGLVVSPCGPRLGVGFLDQHSGRRLLQSAATAATATEPATATEAAAAAAPAAGVAAAAAEAGSSGSKGREAPPGPGPTAVSVVQARAPHLKPQEVYDYLGKFAVPGPMASTPLTALSGGQRCRVALALEMLPRPHVLLLDEPTNHMDLLTVQALAGAVREWEGAVVVASHDLQFLRDTCQQVWVVEGGHVARLPETEAADAVDAYAARLMERVRRRADKIRRQ